MTRGHYSSIAVIKMNDGPALTIDGQPSPYLHLHKPDHLGFSFENTALSILDAVIGGPARAQSSKGGGDNFGAIAGILFLRFANQKVRGLKPYGWEMLVGDVLDWLAYQPEATCRVCHTPGLASYALYTMQRPNVLKLLRTRPRFCSCMLPLLQSSRLFSVV